MSTYKKIVGKIKLEAFPMATIRNRLLVRLNLLMLMKTLKKSYLEPPFAFIAVYDIGPVEIFDMTKLRGTLSLTSTLIVRHDTITEKRFLLMAASNLTHGCSFEQSCKAIKTEDVDCFYEISDTGPSKKSKHQKIATEISS